MRNHLFLLVFLFAIVGTFAHDVNDETDGKCGTARIFEAIHNMKGKAAKTVFAKNTNCDPESYYDEVKSKKTGHFQILYTLSGPHATLPEFVDTLSAYLEKAYKFHTEALKMLPPKGVKQSYHFQQDVDSNLYTVEVIDIDLLRNGYSIFRKSTCGGCYGLTYPPSSNNPEATQLFIDNDFLYTGSASPTEYMSGNHSMCSYHKSDIALSNTNSGVDYSQNWAEAVRVTAYHELYHACQLRYLNMSQYWTFWFEASATGVEKITTPSTTDYIGHLQSAFLLQNTDLNMAYGKEAYGMGVLYLYLYNHYKKDFDHYIWEGFKKYPEETLDDHLGRHLKNSKKDADSLFHDFTTKIVFAGNRSAAIAPSEWIDEQEDIWPSVIMEKTDKFKVNLPVFSYKYYWGGYPDIETFKGKASAAVFKDGKAEIIPIPTTNKADIVYSNKNNVDSIIWIFSHFAEDDYIETLPVDPTLRAYPTPWRGEGALCFTPLPRDKKFIEIRNRRGALVKHIDYEGLTHCIDENEIRGKMAPGVYWFRAGNNGKMEKFMIAY